LPKGLKDWQAYIDLKQKIDDFSECCPLLEMMSNKAMQRRHWDRISSVTGYTFDIESENFVLRHVMEAPLLKYKDDIEVPYYYTATTVCPEKETNGSTCAMSISSFISRGQSKEEHGDAEFPTSYF